MTVISIIIILALLCIAPLAFGLLLLLLFLAYCLLFGWLSLIPFFSWHFKVMNKIWYFGLQIVLNVTVWKFAGIGIIIMIISSFFR